MMVLGWLQTLALLGEFRPIRVEGIQDVIERAHEEAIVGDTAYSDSGVTSQGHIDGGTKGGRVQQGR